MNEEKKKHRSALRMCCSSKQFLVGCRLSEFSGVLNFKSFTFLFGMRHAHGNAIAAARTPANSYEHEMNAFREEKTKPTLTIKTVPMVFLCIHLTVDVDVGELNVPSSDTVRIFYLNIHVKLQRMRDI